MSTYRIEVHPHNSASADYVEASSNDLLSLLGKLEAFKTASHSGGPVYFDDDVLVVVEVTDPPSETATPILSWSRDGGEIYHEGGIVGWQLVNADGINVHGEMLDPFGLQSFEILVGEAAATARAGAVAGGFTVRPVRDGEIENFSVVEALCAAAPRP